MVTHKVEQKEILKQIMTNSSRLAEAYILKNYPSFHSEIIVYTLQYGINVDTFKEKLWHFQNKMTEIFKCVVCKENKTSFNKKYADGYKKYCCVKCAGADQAVLEKRKSTVMEKYGTDNVAKNDNIKRKIVDTNMRVYGTKSTFQNEGVRKKWKENIQDKYGVDHTFQLESVKDSITDTMLDKYGKKRYTQTDEFKEKQVETNRRKFDVDYYAQTEEYIESVKKTNNSKYGSEFYLQSEDYKEKTKIFLDENNVESINQLQSKRDKASETIKNKNKYIYKISHGIEFEQIDINTIKFNSIVCGHESIMSVTSFYKRRYNNEVLCLVCNPFYQFKPELQLIDYVTSLGFEVLHNKKFDNKYQIDIFIPSLNIGIEHNGLYWHGEINKSNSYHQEKTNFFRGIGIDLIHIWEDDYIFKQDIIHSIIANRLGVSYNKIYARNTEVRRINDKLIVNTFLDENHIQGTTIFTDAVGLYYNNELVSVMTFGYRNISESIELIRYCNKKFTNVVGGANRIFKYYNTNINIDNKDIISYQDTSIFNGSVYEILGFRVDNEGYISYWWVLNTKRYNRQKFTKSKLIKDGYSPDKSSTQIMHERGAYRVFGCKQRVWRYKN